TSSSAKLPLNEKILLLPAVDFRGHYPLARSPWMNTLALKGWQFASSPESVRHFSSFSFTRIIERQYVGAVTMSGP
ncbi:hypothetical protein, partial [Pandoraea communis]|uniref:hypothetical protein n=1 Tax=Pandoraea communis TaxID=2508297 RepID=UPI001C2DE82A